MNAGKKIITRHSWYNYFGVLFSESSTRALFIKRVMKTAMPLTDVINDSGYYKSWLDLDDNCTDYISDVLCEFEAWGNNR